MMRYCSAVCVLLMCVLGMAGEVFAGSANMLIDSPAMLSALIVMSHQQAYSITLTGSGLGLAGNPEVNGGGTVDADRPGQIVTSPITGQGSILTIQTNGRAGPGTALNPLLVTVTAKTHLDTISGLPALNDYQAGVIYLTNGDTTPPIDPKDRGLGVRAFTVGSNALRTFNGGLAKIEGSKEISGGTGPSAWNVSDSNGPPHVDEYANFDFNLPVSASSFIAVLTKFETTDKIDLHIDRAVGADIDLSFVGTSNTSIFEEINSGDKVWKVKFSGVPGLLPNDILTSCWIKSIDDDPAHPSGTAEHFLINGLTFDVPEPATAMLLLSGIGGLLARSRCRRPI